MFPRVSYFFPSCLSPSSSKSTLGLYATPLPKNAPPPTKFRGAVVRAPASLRFAINSSSQSLLTDMNVTIQVRLSLTTMKPSTPLTR